MAQTLASARYLNLLTFRKNGAEVATPVWFAAHRGFFYVFSAGDAGKVKRLRNSARARVAPCDVRGALRGDWVDAQAFVVDDAVEIAAAHQALRDKYGWQMCLLDAMSRLGGRYDSRAFIRIEPGAR